MIARIDAPGVPYGPVGFERALCVRRISREPVSDVTFDLESIRKCGVLSRRALMFDYAVGCQTWVPSLKEWPQRPVERPRPRLQ